MPIDRNVQVLILGAGTAGLNAVREARNAGADWLLVEADQYGTTCARVGCMPSKLLIAAAEAARGAREASEFGVRTGEIEIDGPAVFKRVRRYRDQFVQGVVDDTQELPAERRLMGAARFVEPGVVAVGDTRIRASAVVIAVGGAPVIPPPLEDVAAQILTSDSVFELDSLPASLAVIGAGAIGLELGQAFSHLGVDVTLIDRGDSLGILSDPDLQGQAREIMAQHLDLMLETEITGCLAVDGGFELAWERAGKSGKGVFEQVLVSAGRRSNLFDLNLECAGIALDQRGMPEWDSRTTQCADQPVFLAGDANRHRAVLHEAADEGRIAGQNAVSWPDLVAHVRRTPLGIVFSEPQMAVAGQSFDELATESVEIAVVSYRRQGRARVINRAAGAVRLYADRKSCQLIGAELLCPGAEHMGHLLSWVIDQKMRVSDILKLPFYHPVLEEGLRTALRRLAKQLKVTGDTRCEDLAASSGM